MSATSVNPAATPETTASPGWECPICLRTYKNDRRAKRLYQVPVCRKCRNAFAVRRHVAYLVDYGMWWLMLSAVWLLLEFYLLGLSSNRTSPRTMPGGTLYGWLTVFSLVSTYVLPFVFGALKDGIRGRSPGKLLFGLQVIDSESREPIGFLQAFTRNLIIVIPYLNIIGLLVVLFGMVGGPRWGDRWARTQVIWLKHKTKLPFCPDGRYCLACGYDLTGNVSGRCPECGRAIPTPPVQRTYCPSCRGDLTDHAGGWCPQCGCETRRMPELQEP